MTSIIIHASALARYTGHNQFPNALFPLPSDHFWSVNEQLGVELGIEYDRLLSVTESGATVHTLERVELEKVARWVGLPPDASREKVCAAVEVCVDCAVRDGGSVPPNAPDALRPTLRADVAKLAGTLGEKCDIKRFEAKTHTTVRSDKRKWYKTIDHIDVHPVVLVGELDGELQDGRVIEMKRRTHRLYHKVWPSELVQLHCYMFLRNVHKAVLVETFKDECYEHPVEFDHAFWRTCTRSLNEFLSVTMGTK